MCVCVLYFFQSTSPTSPRNNTPEEVANIKKLAMALAPISLSLPPWLVFLGIVVEPTPYLKNISQIGSFPQIGMKIQNMWNHHPLNTPRKSNESNLKMMVWFRWFSGFQVGWIFRFHVDFQGCNMLVKMCFFPLNPYIEVNKQYLKPPPSFGLFVWGCGARGN